MHRNWTPICQVCETAQGSYSGGWVGRDKQRSQSAAELESARRYSRVDGLSARHATHLLKRVPHLELVLSRAALQQRQGRMTHVCTSQKGPPEVKVYTILAVRLNAPTCHYRLTHPAHPPTLLAAAAMAARSTLCTSKISAAMGIEFELYKKESLGPVIGVLRIHLAHLENLGCRCGQRVVYANNQKHL